MSKSLKFLELLKLKKFLTLEETTHHLSDFFEVPVPLSDVYGLALNGELTLSVRFINPTYGLKGRIISGFDGDKFQLNTDLVTGEELDEPYFGYIDDDAVPINSENWFVYDKEVRTVDGIWDLPMIGLERLEIERLYSSEVHAPEPLYTDTYGIYLKQGEVVCRLQNKLEDSSVQEDELKSIIDFGGISLDDFYSGIFGDLTQYEIQHVMYLISPEGLYSDSYEDSLSFKEQSHQYIIKSEELERFIQLLGGTQQEVKPPVKKAYTKNNDKQTYNKTKTQAKYAVWQRQAIKLRKKHPNKSKVWISEQIERLPIAEGRSAGTIKKNIDI